MARAARLLIVDRQPLFRDGLSALLRAAWPDFEIRVTSDPATADPAFDLALVDIDVFEAPGAPMLEAFVAQAGMAPVIVLSSSADASAVARSLAAGARGHLPRTMSGNAIQCALCLALAGGACVPAQALSTARPLAQSKEGAPRNAREMTVLTHLERGRSNKSIARDLGISVAAVKLCVQGILRATGAKNRTEAVLNARRMGLLPVA
ncbi:MAG TPA: response regulator transcription factor [Caulobacterales bacterium]|nr:response regulator transcription factor [Caulobacterales bacterium]